MKKLALLFIPLLLLFSCDPEIIPEPETEVVIMMHGFSTNDYYVTASAGNNEFNYDTISGSFRDTFYTKLSEIDSLFIETQVAIIDDWVIVHCMYLDGEIVLREEAFNHLISSYKIE